MEIFTKASRPAQSLLIYADEQNVEKSHLTNEEAYELLEKKIAPIEAFNERLSDHVINVMVAAFAALSIYAALTHFLRLSNSSTHYNHSAHTITSYQCQPLAGHREYEWQIKDCAILNESGFLTNQGFIIDHAQDLWIPNTEFAVWPMALTCVLPVMIAYCALKTAQFFERYTAKKHHQQRLLQNRELKKAQYALLCKAPKLKGVVDASLITRLTALRVFQKDQADADLSSQELTSVVSEITTGQPAQEDRKLKLCFDDARHCSTSTRLLTESSPVFRAMLNRAAFRESSAALINLKDVNSSLFRIALRFLKTRTLKLHSTDVGPLLELANRFEFSALKKCIEKYACDNIDMALAEESLYDLLLACDQYALAEVKKVLEIKLSSELIDENPKFGSSAYLKYLSIAAEFTLHTTLTLLGQQLKEELLAGEAPNWISQLIDIAEIKKTAFHFLFASIESFFEKQPAALKELWEGADRRPCKRVQKAIAAFCEKDENAHISFAVWPIAPQVRPVKSLRYI